MSSPSERKTMIEQFVSILTAIFWVATTVFVAMLVLSGLDYYSLLIGLLGDGGLRLVFAVLVSGMLICSSLLAWYEFRANPAEEAEYGEWTRGMLFWALASSISLIMAFFFVPAVLFAS